MKILFIIIDGLGDKPIPQLKNKTPLEAAHTPNLDSLVKRGICGLIEPFLFSWQKNPRSDTAHLALFGYDPRIYYSDRGPYEAVGVGMKMQKGDVALRTNFSTIPISKRITNTVQPHKMQSVFGDSKHYTPGCQAKTSGADTFEDDAIKKRYDTDFCAT